MQRRRERRKLCLSGCAVSAAAILLAAGPGAAGDENAGEPASTTPAQSAPAYWQAPPLPQAVIQGGAIPPGWQPQAVPYQGVGPDGKPMTMYFAPTYTFTYQAGPPVPAVPQVNRRRWWGGQPAATMAAPAATGWNYATSGAPPVTTTLPPGGVTQYRSVYRFPPDARGLQGTELMPPGPLPAPPSLPEEAWGGNASGPTQPPAPAFEPAPPLPPSPTQWVPSQPQPVAAAVPPAAIGMAAGSAAVAAYPPQLPPVAAPAVAPVTSPSPPSIPIQPLTPPPATPVTKHLWRVVGVSDGDSVTCLDEAGQQQRVNLAGIDAPETSQAHGRASREALAGMVFGRVVEVLDQGRDSSGTWLARLFVDGNDVNRQMVATGNAWCDAAANDPGLAAAQTEAQSQRLGLWDQPAGDPR